jgi:hypothetical protein
MRRRTDLLPPLARAQPDRSARARLPSQVNQSCNAGVSGASEIALMMCVLASHVTPSSNGSAEYARVVREALRTAQERDESVGRIRPTPDGSKRTLRVSVATGCHRAVLADLRLARD